MTELCVKMGFKGRALSLTHQKACNRITKIATPLDKCAFYEELKKMKSYLEMTREELHYEKEKIESLFEEQKALGLSLDMSRGKPAQSSSTSQTGLWTYLAVRLI